MQRHLVVIGSTFPRLGNFCWQRQSRDIYKWSPIFHLYTEIIENTSSHKIKNFIPQTVWNWGNAIFHLNFKTRSVTYRKVSFMTFFAIGRDSKLVQSYPILRKCMSSCILVCFSCTLQKTITWQWRLLRPEPNKLSHFTHWSDSKVRDVLTAEKQNKGLLLNLSINHNLVSHEQIGINLNITIPTSPI